MNGKRILKIDNKAYFVMKNAPILPDGKLQCPNCRAGEECQREHGQLIQWGLIRDTGKTFPLFDCAVCNVTYTWEVEELQAWERNERASIVSD